MVGGERESMCACETKRGAEGERAGRGTCMCVCVLCVFSIVVILIT